METRPRTTRTNPPTATLPRHEIATADIPVARCGARRLGRRGVETLFLRPETFGCHSSCRARCRKRHPYRRRHVAVRLSRSVFAHGRCETASPDIGERDAMADSAKKSAPPPSSPARGGFANRALTIIWSRSTGGSICSVKDSLQGTLRSGRSGTIRSSWPVTQSVISSKFRNRFLFDRQP